MKLLHTTALATRLLFGMAYGAGASAHDTIAAEDREQALAHAQALIGLGNVHDERRLGNEYQQDALDILSQQDRTQALIRLAQLRDERRPGNQYQQYFDALNNLLQQDRAQALASLCHPQDEQGLVQRGAQHYQSRSQGASATEEDDELYF